jgi:hypothetical protein
MKTSIRALMILMVAALASTQLAAAADYYVSNSIGNDRYDGLAAKWNGVHGPWKSFSKASLVTYQPGDRLLLKCGDVWNETLSLKGDGTATNPIVVSSYGAGDRPYIQRTLGKDEDCIVIDNSAGYLFRDLELGSALNGIHFRLKVQGRTDFDYYHFENCFFHDIENPTFPTMNGPWGWALLWEGTGVPRDIGVVHCIGLRTQGFFCNTIRGKVLFDGDTISHGSLNQVCQTYSTGFNILNCTYVYNYPWLYDKWGTTQVMAGILKGAPGIRNIVENNEFGWPGDYPGSPDGCGYDFEVSTDDVTFRNNFVHDSYGESVLFMGDRVQNNLIFDNNIFRNNVRFSPRWSSTIALPMSVTGSGVFSHNVFYLWPGKTAFGSLDQNSGKELKPVSFTYVDNDEHPVKSFVSMPLVTHIGYRGGARIYTLATTTPGVEIHYTTNASLPSLSSPLYREPIVMKRSGVLNAKAFKNGFYPSYVNSLAVELRNPKAGGPSACWKLNEKQGRMVRDSAGKSNGWLSNAIWKRSKTDNGLAFNGKNASVTLMNKRLSSISNTFTIAFWAKPAKNRAATPEVGSGVGLTGTAWWRMNEGTGDSLGDSAGGTLGSITGCTWTKGKFGNALLFNGNKDSVSLNNYGPGIASDANTFTISFWAEPQATRAITPETNTGISGISGQRYALYPQQYSGASGEAGVGASVGTNGVSVFELAGGYLPSTLVYDHPLTGWNCITLVYRNKRPSLYINGILVKNGLQSDKTVHPAFSLGGSPYGWYQGKLQDVRVYPYALTDSEIGVLANKGEAAMIPWTAGKDAGTSGLPYALGPVIRGGGKDTKDAGVGAAVGVNGVSVCESSDAYLPSVLVDTLPLKGWNHIAVVYQDGQPTLYLNGVFETVGCRSEKTVHPVFNLGGGGNLGWYGGGLADVRVYNTALTDAEVQELAAQRNRR